MCLREAWADVEVRVGASRVETLGGNLEVTSNPHAGTTLAGRIPTAT
jgi:signal transduction histidine kinase